MLGNSRRLKIGWSLISLKLKAIDSVSRLGRVVIVPESMARKPFGSSRKQQDGG